MQQRKAQTKGFQAGSKKLALIAEVQFSLCNRSRRTSPRCAPQRRFAYLLRRARLGDPRLLHFALP